MNNSMSNGNSKIDTFRAMVAKSPSNLLAHYGLANEALKDGLWDEAHAHLVTYLAGYDDEGNGYGRLATALASLGRVDEARDALRKGVESAHRFGHASLAAELSERLDEL
jgi:predicted Zn-dependent protease